MSLPTLRALAKACLANGWEQRKYINRLTERLSNREHQLGIVDDRSVQQDKLFVITTNKLEEQNQNIKILEARCTELQRMCTNY